MEVGNTHVHVSPAGKNMIDITMRRQGRSLQQAPLVVPQFNAEDNSSSSDDDELTIKSVNKLSKKRFISGGSNNNEEDDHDECVSDGSYLSQNQRQKNFQGNMQWDHVQELQGLTNANAMLTSEARDLRQQVKTLQIQLEAQAPVPGLDIDALQDILLEKDNIEHDVRDVRIVHQAKTLRALKRSVQREKQLAVDAIKRCTAFEAVKKQLEKEIDTLKLKLQRFRIRADNGALKRLYEELKSKNTALHLELKKTQRALMREVGGDIPLEEIVGNTDNTVIGSNRRGRAQRIIMLKAKVKKLQAQLATTRPETEAHHSGTTTKVLDVDQRAQLELSGHHMHRQRLLDQLASQRDDLQEHVHRLTRKYDALKARVEILDREKQETHNKFQVLVDKSRTDDALVDALQRQLETWKTKLREVRRARTADGTMSASQEERAEMERLRKVVAEHKSRGGDRTTTPTGSPRAVMPQPSEISQYRAMAVRDTLIVLILFSYLLTCGVHI
ncbi:hypothetical protein PHMEG_00015878 [Phytophthora megakarya]|uniref:Uncharacterized protein n=1 Tax=Phytophthora megakarya TaxID=4795 RepID=A0A225W0N0_9STRA|nr:hypothetical protein PHMEG_00015878 [Phytophthora megakarya]